MTTLPSITPETVSAIVQDGYLPAGVWSTILRAARCPSCGNMTPMDGQGSRKKGRQMPPDKNTIWRHLYCICGESFKAEQVDPALPGKEWWRSRGSQAGEKSHK